ncbi:MAG: peroxiredoxin [Wenzhouxiangellaceae bacterium]
MRISIALAAALLFAATTAPAATVGEPAPEFTLLDQYGESHSLDDFRGKWLVVFFYPKADTPGCTTEACNFRDNIYAIRGAGAEVVGISVDSVDDQKKFSDKYKLPFTLLSDSDGATCDDYGVLRSYGTMEIASRQSFLINPDGVVVKHYGKVNPDTHTQDVIADLEQFTAESKT